VGILTQPPPSSRSTGLSCVADLESVNLDAGNRLACVLVVKRMRGATAALMTLAVLGLSACGTPTASSSRCGEQPPSQAGSALTPRVSTAQPSATAEQLVVIGVWSDCFRPESAGARPGQLVQWTAAEAIEPELVLEDGTSLGAVRHVLEYRFSQPGTYLYHLRNSPQVTGTIVVR
jgi:plastocyanin